MQVTTQLLACKTQTGKFQPCRARTDIVGHSSHPTWNENFCILVADEVDSVNFLVKDDNLIGEPCCHGP